jgi:calcineurin-like phosphoesterase family protein
MGQPKRTRDLRQERIERLVKPRVRPTSMPMTRLPDWVIGDTHFGHDNIIGHSNRPANHDELMIANWKEVVKPVDSILHLGDVHFRQAGSEIVRRAHLGGHVYFLRGNHDRLGEVEALQGLGWKLVEPFYAQVGKWKVVFTHWPQEELEALVINAHGHTHALPEQSARHLSLCVERQGYRPQPLAKLLQERVRLLEDKEALADFERRRKIEWDAAMSARAVEDRLRR